MYTPHQDPFLSELPLGIVFGADLQEQVHQLLQRLRLAGHDESYYVHEEAGLGVAIHAYREDALL
jgi:hypothetical protein